MEFFRRSSFCSCPVAGKAPNSKNRISFHRTFILDLSPTRALSIGVYTVRVLNAVSPRGSSYRYRLPQLEWRSASGL